MSACASGVKPSTPAKGPNAAIAAPPGTPGAATMQMAKRKMKWRNSGKSWGRLLMRHTVRAQQVIFIIEPAMWIVAQIGTQKLAMSSLTPFFFVCRRVTGIVAALDYVPKAVK